MSRPVTKQEKEKRKKYPRQNNYQSKVINSTDACFFFVGLFCFCLNSINIFNCTVLLVSRNKEKNSVEKNKNLNFQCQRQHEFICFSLNTVLLHVYAQCIPFIFEI